MIVTVTVLGNPLNFTGLKKLCDDRGLILFEDNCESIAATHAGKWCGTFGLAGTFSFFYSHHISTIEGGMIVTDDEELFHLCLAARAHGWNREIPKTSPLNQSLAERMKEQYQFLIPGYNLRPLEISGALGNAQLPKLGKLIEVRRKNAERFQTMMKSHPRVRIQTTPHGSSSWYAFTMVLEKSDEAERNRLFEHLRNRGIESRMITGGSFGKQPMSRHFDFTTADNLNHANTAHDCGLFLANHGVPLDKGLDHVDQALKEFGL